MTLPKRNPPKELVNLSLRYRFKIKIILTAVSQLGSEMQAKGKIKKVQIVI